MSEFVNPFKKEPPEVELASFDDKPEEVISEKPNDDPLMPDELKEIIGTRAAIIEEIQLNIKTNLPKIIQHYGLTPSQNRTIVRKVLDLVK